MVKNRNRLSESEARRYIALARRWDCICIVCGRPLQHLACVTKEHIIPKSLGGKDGENIAPSHWNCNSFRGTMSLLDAQRAVERQLRRLGPCDAQEWLSRNVPGRNVPEWALLPIMHASWYVNTCKPILSGDANATRVP